MRFFDPSLEYRKYVQAYHTDEQKAKKLHQLAERTRKHPELPISRIPSEQGIIEAIIEAYERGEDVLDWECFEREDIIAFAHENGIMNDPQVRFAINAAKPRNMT